MVDWKVDWITITVPDWHNHDAMTPVLLGELMEIGRASCRERVL